MSRSFTVALALGVVACAAAARADAAQFHLVYTTGADATSGPAETVDAYLTTDDGEYYGGTGYQLLSATGTRGLASPTPTSPAPLAISFDPSTFNDEIFFPANADGDYVDFSGISLVAGGISYQFYKDGRGDFSYHEYDGSTGRLVAPAAVTVTRVPEPATWASMAAGFGLLGAALRRRGRAAAAA